MCLENSVYDSLLSEGCSSHPAASLHAVQLFQIHASLSKTRFWNEMEQISK